MERQYDVTVLWQASEYGRSLTSSASIVTTMGVDGGSSEEKHGTGLQWPGLYSIIFWAAACKCVCLIQRHCIVLRQRALLSVISYIPYSKGITLGKIIQRNGLFPSELHQSTRNDASFDHRTHFYIFWILQVCIYSYMQVPLTTLMVIEDSPMRLPAVSV